MQIGMTLGLLGKDTLVIVHEGMVGNVRKIGIQGKHTRNRIARCAKNGRNGFVGVVRDMAWIRDVSARKET